MDNHSGKGGGPEGLSPAIIEGLLNAGLTQSDIARIFGRTRQAVSDMARKYSIPRPERQQLLERHFPWNVPAELSQQAPYRRMRDHGEYIATEGKGMSEDKIKRLRSFYKNLRDNNLVLEFDPEIPPVPGVSNRGGFAYRKRRKSDRGLLIRVNEYTHITEEGRNIWTFPDKDP